CRTTRVDPVGTGGAVVIVVWTTRPPSPSSRMVRSARTSTSGWTEVGTTSSRYCSIADLLLGRRPLARRVDTRSAGRTRLSGRAAAGPALLGRVLADDRAAVAVGVDLAALAGGRHDDPQPWRDRRDEHLARLGA